MERVQHGPASERCTRPQTGWRADEERPVPPSSQSAIRGVVNSRGVLAPGNYEASVASSVISGTEASALLTGQLALAPAAAASKPA